eukprot:gene48796-66242_t
MLPFVVVIVAVLLAISVLVATRLPDAALTRPTSMPFQFVITLSRSGAKAALPASSNGMKRLAIFSRRDVVQALAERAKGERGIGAVDRLDQHAARLAIERRGGKRRRLPLPFELRQNPRRGMPERDDPLAACLDDDVLIATQFDGAQLEREHGGLARVIVPKLYAWKG